MFYSELEVIVNEEIGKMVRYHKRLMRVESTVMPNSTHLLIELGDYDNGMLEEQMIIT